MSYEEQFYPEFDDSSPTKYDCPTFWDNFQKGKRRFKCDQDGSGFTGTQVTESKCNVCKLYGRKQSFKNVI
ncbi:MAG: hypothetical protein N3D75_03915 [Candidatus Aenigmarchaeota archaeon]|nr:hypothetical protein [Candidatus Aenigmarchaeota archaeon]